MAKHLRNEELTMTDWEDDASITVINPPGGTDDGGENTPWRILPRPANASSSVATGPWRTASSPARAVKDPGGRLVGRYAMYEEIARGGMASVHLGRSVEPGTRYAVAIKRMFPQLADNPNLVAMFLDEGRLAARVNHPNVVSPVDFVVRAAEGELYLVMEYIHGETLAHLLTRSVRQGNAPATDVAVSIMVGVLRGLHAAHEATTEEGTSLEIIHRDVSPQNIMVGADGVARVVDFGVAKATQELPMDEEERPGKPSYLAPEQIRGNNIDRRSDVFSAGVVLWELLARRRLFRHGNPHVVSLKILAGEIPPPSHFNPDVPTALDAVVLKAMDRRREHRFASARSFADAVLAVLPPASAATTAAWVEQVSGNLLALRAERVAEIIAGPRKSSPLRWQSLFRNELRWRQLMTPAPRGRESVQPRAAWVPWSGAGLVVVALTAMAAWSSAGSAVGGREPPTTPPLLAMVAQVEPAPAAVAAPAAPPPPELQRQPDPPPAEPQPQAEAVAEPELDRETDPTDTREAEIPPAPERPAATSRATPSESRPGAEREAIVAAIKTMNRRALAAYRRAEYETARRMLRAALNAAETAKLHRHRSLALTHTHLGIVLVGGFHQPEMAVQQFRIARQIDPGVLLPRCYVKPQVTAAFRKAGART